VVSSHFAPLVDGQIELALREEHEHLLDEHLESHAMVVQTQAIGEEIANVQRIYNYDHPSRR
jgi:hypothetical protein